MSCLDITNNNPSPLCSCCSIYRILPITYPRATPLIAILEPRTHFTALQYTSIQSAPVHGNPFFLLLFSVLHHVLKERQQHGTHGLPTVDVYKSIQANSVFFHFVTIPTYLSLSIATPGGRMACLGIFVQVRVSSANSLRLNKVQ